MQRTRSVRSKLLSPHRRFELPGLSRSNRCLSNLSAIRRPNTSIVEFSSLCIDRACLLPSFSYQRRREKTSTVEPGFISTKRDNRELCLSKAWRHLTSNLGKFTQPPDLWPFSIPLINSTNPEVYRVSDLTKDVLDRAASIMILS